MNDERQRLQSVYAYYDRSAAEQAKRDPRNPGTARILRERELRLARMLARQGLLPLSDKRILEIGCGFGLQLARFCAQGATPDLCYGIDLLPDRIAAAQQSFPDMHFFCADARSLDFPSGHFDLILAFLVFSSILDRAIAFEVATEMARLVGPGGAIIWYDNRYPNPWNPHVRGYTLRDLGRLFPGFRIETQSITLLPQLARHLGASTPWLYPLLAKMPPLRARYLAILQRDRDDK